MVQVVQPSRIRLEASTFCQLKCTACETAQGITQQKLGGGFLKFKDFQKLIDGNPWVRHIELSNWGEIFLNPEIGQILEYADQKKVTLSASNGANLNTVKPEILELLVKYKFRHITCSIDGASQETYKLYRVGGNFDRVIENIKQINHYKALYKSNFPQLTWQFIVFGHNEHEIEQARRLAKQLQMKFYLKLSWDEQVSPIKNSALIRRLTGLGVASRSEYRQKYNQNYMQKGICSQLWQLPQINWDGRVLGCCYNYWGSFGNAFDEGLAASLNNEKMNHARKMLLGQAEAKEGIPCTSCGHYKSMQESGLWLTEYDTLSSHNPAFSQIRNLISSMKAWLSLQSHKVFALGRRFFR